MNLGTPEPNPWRPSGICNAFSGRFGTEEVATAPKALTERDFDWTPLDSLRLPTARPPAKKKFVYVWQCVSCESGVP
jgi:hypothetical protein